MNKKPVLKVQSFLEFPICDKLLQINWSFDSQNWGSDTEP